MIRSSTVLFYPFVMGLLAACSSSERPSAQAEVVGVDVDASSKAKTYDTPDASIRDATSEPAEAMPADAAPEAETETETETGDPEDPTGPEVCGLTPCAPGAPCPDLAVDRQDLVGSIIINTETFTTTSCAIVEGCITQPGTRRLLRFDTGTENIGNADLTVGSPTQNACFTWSECHQHYHFKGVGKYTLYQTDGTTVAAVGHKQGFCLEDVDPIESITPTAPDPATPFTCTNQGLHVGWEDIYPNDIDCQWIDITGVPAGDYILSVIVDANGYLPESNYDNNEARTPVTIPPP